MDATEIAGLESELVSLMTALAIVNRVNTCGRTFRGSFPT